MAYASSIASPRMFRVAKLIGRKDYPNAIKELEANLHHNPSDPFSRRMLVECYRWSGLEEKAIEAASSILGENPNDFFALKSLGEIYSVRNESDRAAAFVRRALENYPEPTPGVSRRFIRFLKFLSRVFPPLRHLQAEDFSFLEDPNSNDRKWFDWAKQYLAWHNVSSGGGSMPTLH
jgi:tetratricopeptide (TPR) repeat protein